MVSNQQFETQIRILEGHLGRRLLAGTRRVWFNTFQRISDSELEQAIALIVQHLKPFSRDWPSANEIVALGLKVREEKQVQKLKTFCHFKQRHTKLLKITCGNYLN
jgi:hypothetical protein